jgi:hypothetical protein
VLAKQVTKFDVFKYNIEALNIMMDRNEFQSRTYQRVYQYLCRHENGTIDRFHYRGKVEGNEINCLDKILR